jgi:hypothetical protein
VASGPAAGDPAVHRADEAEHPAMNQTDLQGLLTYLDRADELLELHRSRWIGLWGQKRSCLEIGQFRRVFRSRTAPRHPLAA